MSHATDPHGAGSGRLDPSAPFDAHAITRPDPVLMKYYFITALLTVPLFPIVILPLYFRYHTLRYRFDDEGIAMSWGILWRHEIYLTYRRIQDIHVSRGLLQRWLGLATIGVQTASGSATPEMSIDGILRFDELRDFLYQQMRGAKGQLPARAAGTALDASGRPVAAGVASATVHAADGQGDESLALLRQIRDELGALRAKLEQRSSGGAGERGGRS